MAPGDDEFLRRYRLTPAEAIAKLHDAALYLTGYDRFAANDLLGDLLVKLVTGPPPRRRVQDGRAYLRKALGRKWIDFLRRPFHRREVLQSEPLEPPNTATLPDQAIEICGLWERVGQVVGPRDARILFLYYVDDCTQADIARRLGMRPSTVQGRMDASITLLREHLRGDEL